MEPYIVGSHCASMESSIWLFAKAKASSIKYLELKIERVCGQKTSCENMLE